MRSPGRAQWLVRRAPAQSGLLRCARARVLATSGDRAAARRLLADVEKRFGAEPIPPGFMADAHLALGDKDRAFEWLDRAVRQNDGGVILVKVDPMLRGLHGDPRYAAILRRINLPVD